MSILLIKMLILLVQLLDYLQEKNNVLKQYSDGTV